MGSSPTPGTKDSHVEDWVGSKDGKGSKGSDQGLVWSYDNDWGVNASGAVDFARYVTVTPRNISADLQHLGFKL